MIVGDFHVEGVAIFEAKADPPLIVNGNRVLARSIALKFMKTIAWRDLKVVQAGCEVDALKFSQRPSKDVGRKPL